MGNQLITHGGIFYIDWGPWGCVAWEYMGELITQRDAYRFSLGVYGRINSFGATITWPDGINH